MRLRSGRLRRIGWLLTPLVVWAASFFGAWLGAVVAGRVAGPLGGVEIMIAGAVVATIGAGVLWWLVLRAMTQRGGDGESDGSASQ